MKLTPKTIAILKNFYAISPAIFIQPGSTLKTVAPMFSVIASADVDAKFTKKFGLYDVNRFLSSVAMFNDPDLKITSEKVTIADERTSLEYMCAPENSIEKVPDFPEFPDKIPAHFVLTADDIQKLFKAIGILGLPEILISGDGTTLSVSGIDSDNRINDRYKITLGETDKTFKAIFKVDNINKLFPGDYDVKLAILKNDDGDDFYVSMFKGLTEPVQYMIAMSANSQL